jgi:hypothetical protein
VEGAVVDVGHARENGTSHPCLEWEGGLLGHMLQSQQHVGASLWLWTRLTQHDYVR